jgi:hypothetical protein
MGNICVLFSDVQCWSQSIQCAGVAAVIFSVKLLWKSSVQNDVQIIHPLWQLIILPDQSARDKRVPSTLDIWPEI